MIKLISKRPDSLGRVRVEIDAGDSKRVSFAKPWGGLIFNPVTDCFDRMLIGEPRRCRVIVDGIEHFEEVPQTYLVPTNIRRSVSSEKAA